MTNELLEKFLADYGSAKTRATYRTAAEKFMKWSQARRAGDDTLVEYWRWLRKQKPSGHWARDSRKLSEQSIGGYLAGAIAWLTFLADEKQLPEGIDLESAKHRLKKMRKSTRQPYPAKVADPLLPKVILHYDEQPFPLTGNDARDARQRLILLRNRAIMHVLYSTAGRISEVASLKRGDIRNGQAVIQGKGSKYRTLYFTREALAAIEHYLAARDDKNDALFSGHRQQGSLSTSTIWTVVKKAAAAEGVRKIHPHMIRHYRASQMLNEGQPLEVVQEILGHENIGTTRKVYAHSSRRVVREAFDNYTLSPREAMDRTNGNQPT